MRLIRLFLFVFYAAVISTGCKKDLQATAKLKAAANSPLFAKWELRIERGGLQPDRNFAAGNGNIVQFNADSTYAYYIDDAVTKHGTFHIATQVYAQGPEKLDLIYFDKSTTGGVIRLQDNMLTLGDSAADGPSYIYAKK
jgi:hypothetical protein